MKNLIVFAVVLFIPLFFACSPVSSFIGTDTEQGLHGSPKRPMVIKGEGKKEIVFLDGGAYPVPDQWQGRRVNAQPLSFPELTMIPQDLTHNHSKLYLLKSANEALQAMAVEAEKEHVTLSVHSAYRSVWYQRKIFKQFFEAGRTYEDIVRYVAPPGYSEHALGTVADFYPSNWSFASTPAYRWLKTNAERFHFKESYPEHQPDGLPWEAWHWRWSPPD